MPNLCLSVSTLIPNPGTISNESFSFREKTGMSILSPKFEWLAEWESGEINRFDKQIIPPATAVRVGKTYRARVRHKDTTSRWSHWSTPLEFTVSDPDISNFSNLRISELMYNPIGPSESELEKNPSLRDSDFEWIEITNDGNEQVSIEGLRFTKGIEYNFSDSKIKIIKPGESLIIVANEDAFKLRHQFSETPDFVAGTFTKNLSNSGERIKLSYGAGTSVVDFEFKDQFPWPQNADGKGHSLVLVQHRSVSNHQDPKNWRISTYNGGTPGNNDTVIFSGDANGDANSNGISDLMEYATQGELEIETLLIEGKVYSSISYISVIGADEVVTEIESSTDLNNWAVLNLESASISNQLLGNGFLKINIQDLSPLSKNSKPTFYRLRTTKR